MRNRPTAFHLVALLTVTSTILSAGYVMIKKDSESRFHNKHHSIKLSSMKFIGGEFGSSVRLAFEAARSKFTSREVELIRSLAEGKSIGAEADGLKAKIAEASAALRPEIERLNEELKKIDADLSDKVFSVKVQSKNDEGRSGELLIPLVEGLLAEYGPTEHLNGNLVSSEKDDYGNLPVTQGISQEVAPKLKEQFEALKAKSDYNKTTELAHASFLRNQYKFACGRNARSFCNKPDSKQIEENENWFKRIKKEVVELRAKRRSLESLRKMVAEFENAQKILVAVNHQAF